LGGEEDTEGGEVTEKHPMSMPWLDWKPYDGGEIETDKEFVFVYLPEGNPSGPIQACRLKNGQPFVIGGIFAWDERKPSHWAECPDGPEEFR
jgi:hypothetical protein